MNILGGKEMSMSRKTKNTVNMWENVGYEIQEAEERIEKGSVAEVTLFIESPSDEPLDLFEERVKMKGLAQRQGYLVIPVDENKNSDEVEVLLVERHLIYRMGDLLQDLLDRYQVSYWALQEDEEYTRLYKELRDVTESLFTLYRLIRSMQSAHPGLRVEGYHEDKVSALVYFEFKEAFRAVTMGMQACEKFDKELIELQQSFVEMYP